MGCKLKKKMKKGLQLRSGERGQYRKRKRDEGQRLLRLFDKPQEIILSYVIPLGLTSLQTRTTGQGKGILL